MPRDTVQLELRLVGLLGPKREPQHVRRYIVEWLENGYEPKRSAPLTWGSAQELCRARRKAGQFPRVVTVMVERRR